MFLGRKHCLPLNRTLITSNTEIFITFIPFSVKESKLFGEVVDLTAGMGKVKERPSFVVPESKKTTTRRVDGRVHVNRTQEPI